MYHSCCYLLTKLKLDAADMTRKEGKGFRNNRRTGEKHVSQKQLATFKVKQQAVKRENLSTLSTNKEAREKKKTRTPSQINRPISPTKINHPSTTDPDQSRNPSPGGIVGVEELPCVRLQKAQARNQRGNRRVVRAVQRQRRLQMTNREARIGRWDTCCVFERCAPCDHQKNSLSRRSIQAY